jgi:hypothetical protein
VRGLKDKGAARQLRQFATFCDHSLILPVTDAVYLTDCHRAALAGHRTPSLLPTQAAAHHVA